MSGKPETDITGQRFGSLVALASAGITRGHRRWLLRCDCGAEVLMVKSNVIAGHIKQCTACGRKVQAAAITTHGESHDPIYQIFHAARQRCENPKDARYADYGGRGIEFRLASYEQFRAVMGPRPAGAVLDRINNDGHYEVGNLHWATPKASSANTRPRRPSTSPRKPSRKELRAALKRKIWGDK